MRLQYEHLIIDNKNDIYYTYPETNMDPESGWLEDEFPFQKVYFQGLY